MGYQLHGFIGRPEDLKIIEGKFEKAKSVVLTDQISLIPMTADLFDEINDHRTNNNIGKFEYLTMEVETKILSLIKGEMISYIEADYFGGHGGQSGIVWEKGKRIFEQDFDKDVINNILRLFGTIKGKLMDEFDTVRLGRYRRTEDWITE